MNKRENMYGIYDMKYYEQCVGIFKGREQLAKYFNTTSNSIGSTICRREKRNGRYLIIRIEGIIDD